MLKQIMLTVAASMIVLGCSKSSTEESTQDVEITDLVTVPTDVTGTAADVTTASADVTETVDSSVDVTQQD
jgi:hypothetical protein